MYNYVIILSVYSPFSDKVGLPLHNTPFPGVLMMSIGAAFFDRMPFLMSTTCVGCNMCYVFNVNVTDSLVTDGLNTILSNYRAAPTDTNPKNLELAPPQSITATRLDQLVNNPNYYIKIFRLNLFARSED